jgi:hypothetical protein
MFFKMKQRIILAVLSISFLLSASGFSQVSATDTTSSASSSGAPKHYYVPGKMNFGFQLGSQFTSFSGGSGFSTFISPHLDYGVSKRFLLSGGISITSTTLSGNFFSNGNEFGSGWNYTSGLVWLSGQYLVNDRITIEGTAYKRFNILGENPFYSSNGWNDGHGMYMNVRYKIKDNVQIEAGFGYSKGSSPYGTFYQDPFNHSPYDPFFSSPAR